MAELVMRCNNLQCRLELLDKAVVTTCSHLFCLRCAKEGGLFRQHHAERTCPACGTELPKSDDCVATALNPSEDYKSSILAGLSPSIIMDCATRALSFYSYQAMNAVIYQEHLANSLTAKYNKQTRKQDAIYQEMAEELNIARMNVNDYQKSCSDLENKYNDLLAAYKEKSRSLTETQGKYHQLKTQAMVAEVEKVASDDAANALRMQGTYAPEHRAGYGGSRTASISGQLPIYQGPGGVGVGFANSHSNHLRSNRPMQLRHQVQKPTGPSRLSSHDSSERAQDREGRFVASRMQSTQRPTRLPMPTQVLRPPRVAQKASNHVNPQGGYGFAVPGPNHGRHGSIGGLSGPSKRSRTMRSNEYM